MFTNDSGDPLTFHLLMMTNTFLSIIQCQSLPRGEQQLGLLHEGIFPAVIQRYTFFANYLIYHDFSAVLTHFIFRLSLGVFLLLK